MKVDKNGKSFLISRNNKNWIEIYFSSLLFIAQEDLKEWLWIIRACGDCSHFSSNLWILFEIMSVFWHLRAILHNIFSWKSFRQMNESRNIQIGCNKRNEKSAAFQVNIKASWDLTCPKETNKQIKFRLRFQRILNLILFCMLCSLPQNCA